MNIAPLIRVKYTLLCKLTLLLVILLQPGTRIHAQKSRVEITGDVAVTELVQKHIEFNERLKTVPGYRIQIVSLSGSNAKNNAFELKNRFFTSYPDMTAYLIFDEPNFKVKIGDFISRLDAYVFLQYIKDEYPGTIVRDNVYPIRLNLDDLVPETDDDANE